MPQVIVSTTTTLDGYLDDSSDRRLILSSKEDTLEIHRLRTRVGAILIGAETLRKDNPQLNTRYAEIQPNVQPTKIVVTNSGNIDCTANFFSDGFGQKIVFCGPNTPSKNLTRLSKVATVVPCTQKITAKAILEYLTANGTNQLLVEGGAIIQELFFADGCVDILRLGQAPLLLGKHGRARFLSRGEIFPSELTALSSQTLGSTAVTWYQVKSNCEFLRRAAALKNFPMKDTPTHVGGTIILSKYGEEITGTSGEISPTCHPTEAAQIKAQQLGINIQGAIVFTSVEPTNSCCSSFIQSGVAKVVVPSHQVNTKEGANVEALLKKAGIIVVPCDISTGGL